MRHKHFYRIESNDKFCQLKIHFFLQIINGTMTKQKKIIIFQFCRLYSVVVDVVGVAVGVDVVAVRWNF